MKIKLLFLSAMLSAFSLTNVSAQTTKISFEASEPYTLGTLIGQNDWQIWSENNNFPTSKVNVVTTNHTDGTQAVQALLNTATTGQYSGFRKSLSSLTTGADYEVSFDYFVNGGSGGYYAISLASAATPDYSSYSNITAMFMLSDGTDPYYFVPGMGPDNSTSSLSVSAWHNFKFVVKKSNNTLAYYVDSNLAYSGALGASKNINVIDFMFDNTTAGFYIDNLKINNISANLAVGEQASLNSEISVFPNPTSDVLNIKTEPTIASVDILDLKGGLVRNYNDGKSQINISDLPKGVYMLKVKTKTTEFTKKIIKN